MRRLLGALVAALLALTAATACADGGGSGPGTTSSDSAPTAGADGDELEEPLPEVGGEPQADLAGLLVGGDQISLVDGAWCGLASLQDALPDGVQVSITTVGLQTAGAALADRACGGTPYVEAVLTAAGSLSCTVAVVPPTPVTEVVLLTMDAVARCDTQAACDEYAAGATLGQTWTMCHPSGEYDCDPETDDGPADPAPVEPTDPAATHEATDEPTDEPTGEQATP